MNFHSRFIDKNWGSGNGSDKSPGIVPADAEWHFGKPCRRWLFSNFPAIYGVGLIEVQPGFEVIS
ncbi:hypothetical protein AB4851_05900 [Burkholderia sp. 22PA0099]|uniref:hypothetical protein n=1 Tax=Burkholderia sp. 22PA0099 TaxID=3237372 RepID=UPI0039C09107